MYEKRALSKGQFVESGINTDAYHFIDTEGTFQAVLDLKVWGQKMVKNFLTLEDGRKILACTFSRENYLGMADIPLGCRLELTFKRAKKSGAVYLRDITILDDERPTL